MGQGRLKFEIAISPNLHIIGEQTIENPQQPKLSISFIKLLSSSFQKTDLIRGKFTCKTRRLLRKLSVVIIFSC